MRRCMYVGGLKDPQANNTIFALCIVSQLFIASFSNASLIRLSHWQEMWGWQFKDNNTSAANRNMGKFLDDPQNQLARTLKDHKFFI